MFQTSSDADQRRFGRGRNGRPRGGGGEGQTHYGPDSGPEREDGEGEERHSSDENIQFDGRTYKEGERMRDTEYDGPNEHEGMVDLWTVIYICMGVTFFVFLGVFFVLKCRQSQNLTGIRRIEVQARAALEAGPDMTDQINNTDIVPPIFPS